MKKPWPPVEDLIRDLKAPNRYVRCRAAQGLGESGDPCAVEPLLQALQDPAGDVRAKAAVAIGRLRDPRAIGPLIDALRDDKVSVRTGATAAVKKFGKRAYHPLLQAYRGASGVFRSCLIRALAPYKTAEVSELLIAALDDPDRGLHLEIVGLLARRKDGRAVERLLASLDEVRPGLERVRRAWKEIQVEDLPSLQRLHAELAEWVEIGPRLACYIRALGEIRDARAFEPLRELLEIDEWHVQMDLVPAVVTALRKIDNPRAVDLLYSLLGDSSFSGRDRLAKSLAGMDLMNATQSLCVSARSGNVGVLRQALQAARTALEQLHSQRAGIPDTAADPGETSRNGTELIRRLEEVIRGLARGE